jgi:hypothetical protein
MKHVILGQAELDALSKSIFRIRDDKGNYEFIDHVFVTDKNTNPGPVGVYFDGLDLVCWVPKLTTLDLPFTSFKKISCPSNTLDELTLTVTKRVVQ